VEILSLNTSTLGPHGVIRFCKPCRAPFTKTSLIARFYSTGWKTDFGAYNPRVGLINIDDACSKYLYVIGAVRPHIKVEQVRFNGGTAFDDDGKAFIPPRTNRLRG
jgi:hypothetical protein